MCCDKEYHEISMKTMKNITWKWIKQSSSISSEKSTVKLIYQLVHLCNKNHCMLNLLLSVTLVVIVIMWNLSYIMLLSLILVKMFWAHSPPPSTIRYFISQILCEREGDELFYQNKCVAGKCDHCGNPTLFYSKCHIDMMMISHCPI